MLKVAKILILTTFLFGFSQAKADWLSVYAAAKVDSVNGTGDVFENLSPGLAYGLEAGIELIGIDLWGEAIWMADNQAMYSGNLGFDLTFGSDIRVTVGVYTGPILFEMGEPDSDPFRVSPEAEMVLDTARMAGIDVPSAGEIESQYNQYFGDQADEIDSLAFGWNIARGRLQVEYEVFPFAYVGMGGQYGYHMTISGDDVTGAAKTMAVDQLVESDELSDVPEELKSQLADQLKQDIGASEPNTAELNGTNYNVGAYFKLEI